MFNQVILVGKIVGTPVFTTTHLGAVQCKICIEVERPFKQIGAEDYGKDLMDVYIWEGIALTIKDTLKRGSIVMIRGRLEQCNYISSNSGEIIHPVRVIGERIMYMSNKEEEEERNE